MVKPKKIILKGVGASPGTAEGNVKVILSLKDLSKMKEGNVLISLETNPQLIPAMLKASAIVTEIGGILSHAAIVARELGIPCVVGAKNATSILHENAKVVVDGRKGYVYKAS